MNYKCSVYTRAYRLPLQLGDISNLPNKDQTGRLKGTFDSRYLSRDAVDIISLDSIELTLESTERPIHAQLEVLYHHLGHAVAIVTLTPESTDLGIEELKLIQDHWILPRPECEIFRLSEEVKLSINDLCSMAIVQLLSMPELRILKDKMSNRKAQALLVKSTNSIEAIYKALGLDVRGFYIPNIFGCISFFESANAPSIEQLLEGGYKPLIKGTETSLRIGSDALLVIERNSALVVTNQPGADVGIYSTQFALLNLVRHFGNYVNGELNVISQSLVTKNKRSARYAQKIKALFAEMVFCYDELHDMSLWNSPELVRISQKVRSSEEWRLNEETDAMNAKLDSMAKLTTEIAKFQSAKQRKHVTSLLAALGVINLLQMIPIWEDYVSKALHFWTPAISILIIIAVYVNYKIDDID
jgi:hypothetical protein